MYEIKSWGLIIYRTIDVKDASRWYFEAKRSGLSGLKIYCGGIEISEENL